jgi:hypothetical protein
MCCDGSTAARYFVLRLDIQFWSSNQEPGSTLMKLRGPEYPEAVANASSDLVPDSSN